jgi:1-acyl-sn-glycerol-3-phosphate acyltransferase
MEYLPPRWVRRLIITPLVFVGSVVITVASPAVHLVAAILDLVFDRRRWRISRVVGIGLAFAVAEVFGLFALLTVWVGSGFGLFMRRPLWVKANNVLAGQYMAMVTNAIAFFVGFRFSLSLDVQAQGPHLVFARHAGPGDALRLMKVIFRDMGRRCHAIGAAKLQWDPFLDIAGERLGFHYLLQTPTDTQAELDKIRRLTASMGEGETLILCPEGGNFTPKRRDTRIGLERSRGREDRAELAQSLKRTLLPKTGGVMAALEGAPHASVTFLGHAGLDDIHGFRSLWDKMPLNRTVVAHAWTVSLDDLPEDRAGRSEWLLEHWRRVDDWIDEALAAQSSTT